MKKLTSQEQNLDFNHLLSKAFEKIGMSVSKSEQSSEQIRRKLKSCGFGDDVVEAAIEKAKSLGLIDDIRYLDFLARKCIRQKRGFNPIKRAARELNIDLSQSEEAMKIIEVGEVGQAELAREYLEQKIKKPSNKTSSNQIKALIRRGFSAEVARKATDDFNSDPS